MFNRQAYALYMLLDWIMECNIKIQDDHSFRESIMHIVDMRKEIYEPTLDRNEQKEFMRMKERYYLPHLCKNCHDDKCGFLGISCPLPFSFRDKCDYYRTTPLECDTCKVSDCPYRDDPYNVDADCLATK